MAKSQMDIVKLVKHWLQQKAFFGEKEICAYVRSLNVDNYIDLTFWKSGTVNVRTKRRMGWVSSPNLNYHHPDFFKKLEELIELSKTRNWGREQLGEIPD